MTDSSPHPRPPGVRALRRAWDWLRARAWGAAWRLLRRVAGLVRPRRVRPRGQRVLRPRELRRELQDLRDDQPAANVT